MVICILQFIKSEIKKIYPFSANIKLTFEDRKISKEQYSFLKNHLDRYRWYIDDEYPIISEVIYNESSGMLLIMLNIMIPECLMPNYMKNQTQMMTDHIKKFPKFYERHIQLHYPEIEKKLKNLYYSH